MFRNLCGIAVHPLDKHDRFVYMCCKIHTIDNEVGCFMLSMGILLIVVIRRHFLFNQTKTKHIYTYVLLFYLLHK